MNTKTLALAVTLALTACTHPADVSRPLTEVGDKNAHFAIKETPTGFSVDVKYSRYQFVPEAGALLDACRSLVTSRAYDEAKARGREIEPIDKQTIRVSTGRNIIKARTACRAFAEAKWKR
ncbi:hypothetical protein SFC76_08060 [Sphingomonas sp. CD22]|uniref:hypothetical protein n=1 Tax=Sphingomonas sp. CD22 TaxID=3100214 RepID=UPI002AE073CB|nr:hypothetical protein [Sphingomonas sp. CD22]MEA1084214.1 hypothetical protein [Sphingomonas sp. CD22]